MRKTLLYLVFSCMIYSLNAQTYNVVVSDDLMHEFLDSYLDDFSKSLSNKAERELIIDYNPIRFENPDTLLEYLHNWNNLLDCSDFNLDSLLNEYDQIDMVNQLKSQKEFTWEITHAGFSFDKIKEPKWTDFYYKLSMPIFSKSRKVAIIKQTRECGDDCGELWINVYLKEQNSWILIAGWGYII